MKRKSILFLDDDRYEMLGLVERLEAVGFEVRPCTHPREALDLIKGGYLPDAIISDLIMRIDVDSPPDRDRHVGIAFCREVRQRGLGCPIVVLTVVTDDAVIEEAKRYASAFLIKPVVPSALVAKLKELL